MNTECLKLMGDFTGEDEIKFLRYVSVAGVDNTLYLGWVWAGLSKLWKHVAGGDNALNQYIWDNIKNIANKVNYVKKDYRDDSELSPFIFRELNRIMTSTRRTSGNVIVYNNQFKPYLEKLAPIYNAERDSFNGVINCFNSHLDGEKPEAVVTYTGIKNTDSGLGYVRHNEDMYEFFFDVPAADKYYTLITIE